MHFIQLYNTVKIAILLTDDFFCFNYFDLLILGTSLQVEIAITIALLVGFLDRAVLSSLRNITVSFNRVSTC